MSFTRRNIALSSSRQAPISPGKAVVEDEPAGTRPSPLDGRLTTSTGTRSLDALLAGHGGLPIGTSLLVEENGTTDFAGVVLRYFTAEGVAQNHHVHVLGVNEAWGRDLPGLAAPSREKPASERRDVNDASEKMKIAWRYERLGEFGREKQSPATPSTGPAAAAPFTHDFDLTKRLTVPADASIKYVSLGRSSPSSRGPGDAAASPLAAFTNHLLAELSRSPRSSIHRVVIPNLLSPAIYPNTICHPRHILQFLHGLRALLRKYPNRLTAMVSLPTILHPRTTGLTRLIESLFDGVMEILPFLSRPFQPPKDSSGKEEAPQGMLRIYQLPILHEKGGSFFEADGLEGDLAFTLSRRKGLVMKPFTLPPVEGEEEHEHGGHADAGKAKKADLEF